MFGKERYIKQINDIQVTEKKTSEFCCLAKKGHIWKESGVPTQGRREVEVCTLLLRNDKKNVIADKVLG